MPERKFFRRSHNWMAASLLEFATPVLKSYARWQTGRPTPATTWRRGLLAGAHHIGDILYRTSSLPQLAQTLPDCDWDIIAPWPSSELLENNPHIQNCWNPPTSASDINKLSSRNYDVLLAYDTVQYGTTLNLGIRLGIPNRVAHTHKGLRGWVTYPCPIRHPQPYPAYFRDMVEHMAGKKFTEDLRPRVYTQPVHREKAREILAQNHMDNGNFFVMFISSRQPSGVCPTSTMIACMKQLLQAMPMPVVLAGAKSDERVLREAAKHLPVRDIWAGSLPLMVLVECLRQARFVLTTDSGPRHLANAAGTPVAFPRNIFFHPREAGCYLTSELDLIPANIGEVDAGDDHGHFRALETSGCRDRILEFLDSQPAR